MQEIKIIKCLKLVVEEYLKVRKQLSLFLLMLIIMKEAFLMQVKLAQSNLTQGSLIQGNINTNISEPDYGLKEIFIKLVRWLIFSIIGGVTPLILNYLVNFLDTTKVFVLKDQISHGELLLISIAIGVGTMGEIFGLKTRYRLIHLISGGIGFISYVYQLVLFYRLTNIPKENMNVANLEVMSILFFCTTIVVGLTHLVLSEVK